MPLSHPPGEAQVDFGFADVWLEGELTKVALFVMTLPYSDAIFIQAFPRECTEVFLEGHRRAFEFFGGVPTRISYDNSKIAVASFTGSRERKITKQFQRRKPGGFDHARPLENWELPVCFGILRRRLEAELDGVGTREFIKVLRLLETHSLKALKVAVQHALEIGTTNSDAVRLILEYQQEEPVALFCLDGRPHLKLVRVAQTDISVYQSLLMEGTIV